MRTRAPAGGDNLKDLIGRPQAWRYAACLETPHRLIIPLSMPGANLFVRDKLGQRSRKALRSAVRSEQLGDQRLAEEQIYQVHLTHL